MTKTLGFLALTLTMALAGQSPAQDDDIALERTVSDAERELRAIITYRPEVMTGGQEEIIGSDGTVSILNWDGFMGQFTAQITEGSISGPDAEAFLREAVIAVCPSVDQTRLNDQWVQTHGSFLRIFAQCPEVDAGRN